MGKTRTTMRVPTDAILDSQEKDRLQHCVRSSMFSFREAAADFGKIVEVGGTNFMTLRAAEQMQEEFTRYANEAEALLEKLDIASQVVCLTWDQEYED